MPAIPTWVDRETEDLVASLHEQVHERYFGKYRGVVRDVDDPESMGRIVAQVPEVYGEMDSPWAMPSVPAAGPSHGFVALPRVGEGVWIEFEAGDLSRPIWSGCWWARGELPAPNGPDTRTLITAGGHQLVLDDEGGTVQLLHAGGAELTMTASDITLKIGAAKVVLSSAGVSINNGAFEVR